MAFRTSSLFGSGVEFIPLSHSGALSIPASSTGDLAIITPPSGQKVRVDFMFANGGTNCANISVAAGATTVINNLSLARVGGSLVVGAFCIGDVPKGRDNGLAYISMNSTISSITTRYSDDTIVISTTTPTASAILYAFTYGE